ncbi:hypothetical protein O0I10_007078 [Lichtheimia ornata]|uniref:MYND-type domain-containing protein n=1 Tax=Lichtheimia ornata TaxID=688661 RepID=A0AAD7Y0J3_9FUNG|nr:uncharacterized protein O0I10_007078 [Lichtheimia ornata]KAJ8657262.1 hypothetical protein O0I10_007078 [Lichtheimia ornata]
MAENNQNQLLGMKPKTAALVSVGVVASALLGYLVYFDHKRRSDPHLKKQRKREKKEKKKKEQAAEEEAKASKARLIETVLDAVAKETLPTTAEAKEQYFMSQVAAGEQLCNAGPEFYEQAVLPFYKALKVYPAPLELIMIYQKTVPEPVFQTVVQIMALEQTKRQAKFYEDFPPKDTHVRLAELPAGETPEGKPIVRRGLVANEDLEEGQVIYTESPLVSGLYPSFEGSYCNYCLKKVTDENKVACENCDKIVYCSKECENTATESYHRHLCSKDEKALTFVNYANEKQTKYPTMVAKFLTTMVAEEVERTRTGKTVEYNAWDHMDRFRYLDTQGNDDTKKEIEMLKDLLGSKVTGINEFLTDEIYLMLKGKLLYNAYAVNIADDTVEVPETSEHMRKTETEKKPVGAALYKISTYIGQSKEEPNVKVVFGDNHDISIVATKAISKETEITADYTLPVPV